MKKHVLGAAAALAVTTAALLSPGGPAQAAAAAPSCSVGFGPKLAIDAPYEEFKAELKSNCAAAGVDYAYWDLIHPREGEVEYLDFEEGQTRTSIDFYAGYPLGTYTVRPAGAWDEDTDTDVAQNTFTADIRRQSQASLSSSRSGRNVTLTVTAKYYEPTIDAYRAWRGNKVLLQVQVANGGWKTMATVTTDSAGKATHKQTAGTATWRAVVQPASTVWDRTTASRTV